MSRVNRILFFLVLVLIVLLGVVFLWKQILGGGDYSAVYLKTGDIYFGRLQRFPSLNLKNIYTLQVNSQDPNNPITIRKFKDVFWGPEDSMKLNEDEVVWITKLNEDGQLAKLLLENPDLLPQTNAVGDVNMQQPSGNNELINQPSDTQISPATTTGDQ